MTKLPFAFYQSQDVNELAVRLLGKRLCARVNGEITTGLIVETEAYKGAEDRASHAYGRRFTPRTQVMYEPGGVSYVYLCYGIHYLFNVVTGPSDTPHAVLIRGLAPVSGIDIMLQRRKMQVVKPNLTAGPGALAKAMGIDKTLNGKDLSGDEIWIEDAGISVSSEQVVAGPRIGVDYAGDDALLPWRYYLKGNAYVSRPNAG